MASGFLILPDGRCFAIRTRAFDATLRQVIDSITDPRGAPLRQWLTDGLPGPDAIEDDIGTGSWVNKDAEVIPRDFDLRLIGEESQQLFCEAAITASLTGTTLAAKTSQVDNGLHILADMVHRYRRGEPALSQSHWTEVVPPQGNPLGF